MPYSQDLLKLIEDSNSILVTSHISPDPDAVCSSLLLAETLRLNFPTKTIVHNFEDVIDERLAFLSGYGAIQNQLLPEALEKTQPDLLIITDANSLDRLTREVELVDGWLKDNKTKLVIIDHHEKTKVMTANLFIHRASPAATLDVYHLLLRELGLKRPEDYADTAMLGLISDTGRFLYKVSNPHEMFEVAAELVDAGASIEQLNHRLEQYSLAQVQAFGEFCANFQVTEHYTYSFISQAGEESYRKLANKETANDIGAAKERFVDMFMRNVENRTFGFTVSPDMMQPSGNYRISFRSLGESVDVSKIANELGGGGHKPAAGATIQASSVSDAIKLARKAIKKISGL